MIFYDTHFVVKYKDIELDLEATSHSSKEDQETILDELYRHEILSVFQIGTMDDIKIDDTLLGLYEKIKTYAPFVELFMQYKKKIFTEGFDDIVVFSSLFSYDTLYLIHPCMCEFLEKQSIGEPILNKWREYIHTIGQEEM